MMIIHKWWVGGLRTKGNTSYMTQALKTSRVSTILVEIIFVMIWPLTFGTTFYDSEFVFVLLDKFKMTHVEIGLWGGGLIKGKTLYDASHDLAPWWFLGGLTKRNILVVCCPFCSEMLWKPWDAHDIGLFNFCHLVQLKPDYFSAFQFRNCSFNVQRLLAQYHQ